MREEGYYWVKYGEYWCPDRYYEGMWETEGEYETEYYADDHELLTSGNADEIGPRIRTPSEIKVLQDTHDEGLIRAQEHSDQRMFYIHKGWRQALRWVLEETE